MAEDAGQVQPAAAVAVASAALGRQLTSPVELASGGWSTVLRCTDPAGGTLIVKAYPVGDDGASSFAAEAAGLEFAGGSGLTPALLAVAPAHRTLVMSDLGSGGSLADALLGNSAATATSAMLSWADACGSLAAAVGPQRATFDAVHARYLAGGPDERHGAGLADRIRGAAGQAATIGVAAPPGLDADIAVIVAAVTSDRHAVFSPGDVCPDNNLLTNAGVRFLDFEEAGFHSAFLDAAYIRMPFSTCWCVFGLPPDVSAAAEAAYRAQASLAVAELADEAVWARGLRLAMAAWTLSSTTWLLRRALAEDVPMNPDAESPGARQLVRYRWQRLAADLDAAGELPAVAELMRAMIAATTAWHAPDLPLYPAFRS